MSYSLQPMPAKVRPGTVTAASWLLYLCAVSQVSAVAVSLMSIGAISSALEAPIAGTPDADAMRTAATVGVVIGMAIAGAFAIGTAVLGNLVGKGRPAARIVTWVLGSIGVLCYGCGLAGNAITSQLSGSIAADPASLELQRAVEDAIPGWQQGLSVASQLVQIVALIAVIILLMLPSANEYFRKADAVWVPPTYSAGPSQYGPGQYGTGGGPAWGQPGTSAPPSPGSLPGASPTDPPGTPPPA